MKLIQVLPNNIYSVVPIKKLSNQIIGHDTLLELLTISLEQHNYNHFIIDGAPGVGKASIIQIIVNSIIPIEQQNEYNFITIHLSSNRNIQHIRDKLQTIATCKTNTTKIIVLKYANNLAESVQQIIRSYMEKYSIQQLLFIFHCDTINNLIEPIRSHCYYYKLNKINIHVLTNYLATLINEMNFQYDSINTVCKIAEICDGNVRKSIHILNKIALHILPTTLITLVDVYAICMFHCYDNIQVLITMLQNNCELKTIFQYVERNILIQYTNIDFIHLLICFFERNETIFSPHIMNNLFNLLSTQIVIMKKEFGSIILLFNLLMEMQVCITQTIS